MEFNGLIRDLNIRGREGQDGNGKRKFLASRRVANAELLKTYFREGQRRQ